MNIYYGSSLAHHGIMGQKWGVRRYQNKDGTLTERGKKRYDRDIRENNAKKKDSRIVIDGPDPDRWVKEDLTRSKRIADVSSDVVGQAKRVERETSPKAKRKPRMDLSNMSDKDLQNAINREQLERRYNDLFNEAEAPKISKGRQVARATIEVAGGVLAATSSALGIALAIKDLKGGK